MKYHQIKNSFFNSNTFIIENKNKKIIIIDPGNPDVKKLVDIINRNKWHIEGVILTHEHADHVAGLLGLYNMQPFPVYCSKACSVNIRNCKKNLSKYIEEINTFELNIPTQLVGDGETFNVGEFSFFFIETPGHSPGGACIFTSDAVFVGDTILNKEKVPLSFPHSDKIKYNNSLKRLKNHIKPGVTIYPGHGESFVYTSLEDTLA